MNILITGISSGIGEAIALHYLEKGHHVYGISRNDSERLQKFNNFSFLSFDLTKFEELPEKIQAFLSGQSHLDHVILNAGFLSPIADMKETSLDILKKSMDVNVWSNKILLDTLITQVKKIDQVVAISSGAAVSGNRGWNGYAISKAALNMLIELYAEENPDIHFTALAPGIIDTKMQDYISSLPDEKSFPVIRKLKEAKGTESMLEPDEAAPYLVKAFEEVKKISSGSFIDIRDL